MIKRFIAMLILVGMVLTLVPVAYGANKGVTITTDKQFFTKLDLNRSGLEKVKTAVEKSDYTTAKKELLSYYKSTFANYDAKPFSGANNSQVFLSMNNVWAFSESYLAGQWITGTTYEPYTFDLSTNLTGIYVLDQIYATTDGVAIGTSESGNPPRLELYSSNGTLLTTLTATEDTAVRPGKDLSAGYGNATVIYAKHWPDTSKTLPYSTSSSRCYVRFDTTQIPSNAKTAKLVLHCRRSPGHASGVLTEDQLYLSVFQSYCTNWSEDSLTWDSLVGGHYVGHYSYDGLSGGFDWKKPTGTPSEWLNYNTRFYEVRSLVIRGTEATDQATKDSYMNKAKELVLDFINDAGHNTPANRALEPANRLIEFPYIYKHLVCGGYISADENIKMLSWLYDDTTDQYNGAYTIFTGANAIPKGNLAYTNWGLWHLTGFYSALNYFPEFSESGAWRNVYDARLGVVMGGIIKEDGSYNEVTYGYPGNVLSWCATLKDIMNQFGDTTGNAAMFSQKMLLLTKYLIDCSLPNGKLPFWGEGGPSTALSAVNTTLATLTTEELKSDLAKYLQHYKDQNYGLELDTMSQYDGIQLVTDRTGWEKTDSMIFMNAKSAGSHSHRDALALLLHYRGRNLLADTGMTSYDGSHLHFPFQRSTTRSHNTIEVDGTAQTLGTMVDDGRSQGDIDITGNSAVSTITSWSTANNPNRSTLKVEGTTTSTVYHSTTFTHSRAVSYIKELGSILVVTDKVVPGDSAVHQYTQNWHCAPYSNAKIEKDSSLTGSTAYSAGANLIIAQASTTGITASTQTGYDSTAPATPTKYFEYKQSASGTVTYQTVLYPVSEGATATVAPKKLTMSGTADHQALAMEIAVTDSSKPELSKIFHYHTFETSPAVRTFGSYSTDSTTAMAALDQNGELYFASVSNGSSLSKSGKVVLQASARLTDLAAVYENGVLTLYSEDVKAKGLSYTVNMDGKEVTAVYLQDAAMTFTPKADGTVEIRPTYVLLDFTEDTMASQTGHWNGFRATATVNTGKGILSGDVNGGDPNIRMNATAEALGYRIVAGDIVEIRMKTAITEGSGKGVQVFFRDGSTSSYSEAYSVKNMSLDHATGRYSTIQLPFLPAGAYVGSIIDNIRLDMLHIGSADSVTATYEVDYIYIGPKELAPSATAKETTYLYFGFSNKTVDNERYALEAYGGYPFDLDCWGYNPSRTTAPQIDNTEGTLSVHILPDNTDSYVETKTNSTGLVSMPLYYLPKAGDTVQVGLRFENAVTTTTSPELSLYYVGSDSGTVTNDHSSGKLNVTAIESGEYMVVTFPVSQGFLDSTCINALRFTVSGVADDGSGSSRIVFDYFYVGTQESLPMQDHLYFGFDNRPEDQERYSTATYGGYNFDLGNWGANTIRALVPVLDPEAGTLSVTLAEGSSNPYFQTTTGPNTLSTKPLTYIPGEADLVQLKVKFQNCKGSSPYLCLYYMKDNSGTVTNNNSKIPVDATLLDADTYNVLTFPVPDGFTAAQVINAIRITGVGISEKVKGQARLIFDYIYIGSEEDLPTKRYNVTFRNGDGSILETVKVHQGETADYSGSTPTKAPDSKGHYSFTGWNQTLSDISGNLIVDPLFAVTAHSYVYGETEDGHRGACSCGYTAEGSHSWDTGEETTAPTCTVAGVKTFTCTLCKATKTESVSPKGHRETIDKAVAPTCTKPGLTEGAHCSVCKEVLKAQEVVDATGHIFTVESCTVCGTKYVGTLLHFTSGSPELEYDWSAVRHCSVPTFDPTGKGFAKGIISSPGGDTHTDIRFAMVAKENTDHLNHKILAPQEYVQIRVKLEVNGNIPADSRTKVYFKTDAMVHSADYSEGYMAYTQGSYTDEEGYSILTIAIPTEYAGQVIETIRIDFLDGIGHSTLEGTYCVDYIYMGPGCTAPLPTHTYVDGMCSCGEKAPEPVLENTWKINHTLNLASDISVNLAVSKGLLAGFDVDTVYILTEQDLYEGNEKIGVKTVKLLPVLQGNYYYFTLTGLTAVNMNDRIRSVLYGTKNGQEYYSPIDDYSIADYAYGQMSKAANMESLRVLCADLLRYGTKAQIYKNYRLDHLADAKMTAEQRAYLSDMETVTFGNTNTTLNDLSAPAVKWQGKALNLDSKVCLKFIFSMGAFTGDVSELELRVSYKDNQGAEKNVILKNAELYNSNLHYYAFTLDTLLAAELRSVISVQIYTGDIPVSCTLQYSADTYGNNKTGNLLELCKALFAYSDSAKAYFAG